MLDKLATNVEFIDLFVTYGGPIFTFCYKQMLVCYMLYFILLHRHAQNVVKVFCYTSQVLKDSQRNITKHYRISKKYYIY
jgi:hypothetical protein